MRQDGHHFLLEPTLMALDEHEQSRRWKFCHSIMDLFDWGGLLQVLMKEIL